MDKRFNRLYILKIEDGEIPVLKRICEQYNIKDNSAFEKAASFHRIWGIGPEGIIYLSFGMAEKGFDFNSIDELEDYLLSFEPIN